MLKKLLKISIIITLFILGFSTSISQIKIDLQGYLNYSSRTQIDSIFVKYESPNLPDSLYSFNWGEINIICDILTDTLGRVKSIYTYPLNKNDIYIESDSRFWDIVTDSIKSISKEWILKVPEWDFEKSKLKEDKKLYEALEKIPSYKPFNGIASFLIILSICNECRFNNHLFYHHINNYENRLTR